MTRDNEGEHELSNESNEYAETGDASEDASVRHDDAPDRENASVTAELRTEVLSRDGYRCQTCGRRGPEQGGVATLHVHHIEREPVGIAENAPGNLTTLCRSCHSWVHQQKTPDEAPVSLTDADVSVLLPQDIEILQFLAAHGPARTGDVAAALTADLSVTAVRERLAVLMGLDNQVESRDEQIVDQDVETGEWGLTEQIEHSARGHIPTDPQALVQRVEDEQVRQALERGYNREVVTDVFDVSRRTTFHKEKRARAYGFPLDAFRRGGNGGQHPAGSAAGEVASTSESVDDAQQQLASGGEGTDAEGLGSVVASDASAQQERVDTDGGAPMDGDDAAVHQQLRMVIAALQQVTDEL